MSEDTQTEVRDTPEVLLHKLKEANAEAKRHREAKEALESRVTELESADGTQVWKDKAVKAYVKSALREHGVADVERTLKVLSLDGVDLDDNDTLTGFDEKVAATKKEWPELFDVKRRVGGKADLTESTEPKQKAMTSTEAQVARLFGN